LIITGHSASDYTFDLSYPTEYGKKNIMKMLLLISSLLFIGCSSTPSSRVTTDSRDAKNKENIPTHEILPFSGSFAVNRIQFPNGLKLLVVEDHSSPTFAYQTWFKVGSRNEVLGKTGLAHLFEHMMFKETKNLKDGEFDRLLEGAGAEGENAFTSRDFTAYIQEMPSTQLELIIKAESDRMTNVIVNDQSFKTEREVVQNERRFRNENSPDGIMNQELFELAFNKHSYHWPVIGYQRDLESMSAKDAAKFYSTYYAPNHATILVVGDVNTSQVKELVQRYYGSLAPQPTPKVLQIAEPTQGKARKKQLKLNIQVEKLLIGYKIPGFAHEDMPTLNLIQNLLTGGKNNRLRDALVETGVASAVNSDDFEDRDPSLFVIMANLQKGKSSAEAEKIILAELKRLANEPVSNEELQRAKNKSRFSFYQALGSNYEKAYFLGAYESLADHFSAGLKHEQRVAAATADDVLRVAKKYFHPKSRTVIQGVRK
jgi:zinc protease